MDEVDLKRRIQKADTVERMIETYKPAWAEVEAEITAMWISSKADEDILRQHLWHEHHAIRSVQARFQRIVNDGKKAEAELRELKARMSDGN